MVDQHAARWASWGIWLSVLTGPFLITAALCSDFEQIGAGGRLSRNAGHGQDGPGNKGRIIDHRKVADAEHIATAKRMKADGHTGKNIAKYLG